MKLDKYYTIYIIQKKMYNFRTSKRPRPCGETKVYHVRGKIKLMGSNYYKHPFISKIILNNVLNLSSIFE